MADQLHPLVRDRRILAEAIAQLALVADLWERSGRDAEPYRAEYKRLIGRLYRLQRRIEELDVD